MKIPTKSNIANISPPREDTIAKICTILTKQLKKEEHLSKYAPVREVLALLGKGALLTAAILAPKSASILLPLVEKSPSWDDWRQYNVSYLKRTLKRLEQQKQIEIVVQNGKQYIQLSKNGKRKILRYSLELLTIEKPKRWDGKWRLILYDIPSTDRRLSEFIRETLKNLGCYQIQKSIYLFPYPCFDQIEFLREFHCLGNKIQYMIVEQIENDSAYKTYFGLS